MKIGRHIKQFVRFTIITLLVCYFGIIAILNLPLVQKQLTALTSKELSNLFHTEISIGNIDLGLLNRIIIQNLKLNDQQGKELLKIARFSAKFDIPELLHGRIRIHSVQLFGLHAMINRPSPQERMNVQFILDTFASKDSIKKEKNIDLRINSVLIRRGEINYDIESEPETPGVLNKAHLGIQNLSATLSLKAFTNDSLNMQVRRMNFNEKSGFKIKKLTMKVTGNREAFHAQNVELRMPRTIIQMDTLTASYGKFERLTQFKPDVRYLGQMKANITPADFKAIAPQLKHFNAPILIDLKMEGKGGNLSCDYLDISNNDGSIMLQIDGSVNHLDTPKNCYLTGNVSNLLITQAGSSWLYHNLTGKNELPNIASRIENVHFNGKVSGWPNKLTTMGRLSTGIGIIEAQMTMHTDTINNTHSYSGSVSSNNLNLGKLTNKPQDWGKTVFNVELNGLNYHNGKAESYIKGVVSSLVYRQYEYKNILLDGHFKPGGFNGKIALDDPNGKIEINGRFATQQSVPEFNLTASMLNLKPNMLNITKKYENMDFSADLTANFKGHSIDDVLGSIILKNLKVVSPQKAKNLTIPELSVTAHNDIEEKVKQIKISSPFINGEITGKYLYRTIPNSLYKLIPQYMPSAVRNNKFSKKNPENSFYFNLKIEDSPFFSEILNLPITLNMPVSISGSVDDHTNQMELKGYLPEFIYNGGFYESGTILCNNMNGESLKGQFRVNKRTNKGVMINMAAFAEVKNDCLYTTLNWGNNTSNTFCGKVIAETRLSPIENTSQNRTEIQLMPSEVILNDVTWNIHPSRITIEKEKIQIDNFLFEHQNRFIKANGVIGKNEEDACQVELKNIELQYVMNLIQFHAVEFEGKTTGTAYLGQLLDKRPVLNAKLKVQDFKLNHTLLGQADIDAEWDREQEGIRLAADIRESKSLMTYVDGYISPKQKGLDLNIKANGTNLAFLHKFTDNIFKDLQGRATGEVRLFGPFSKLDLEGYASADARLKVGILNTYFNAHTDSLTLRQGNLTFKDVKLWDDEGHTGRCNGELNHTKLKNLNFRFNFNTQNMLVYHTEKESVDFPFYGKMYTSGNMLLRGGNGALNVDGTMRTEPQTSFTYVTTTAAEATSNQFITFHDKTPRRKLDDLDTDVYHYLNRPDEKKEEEIETDIRINLQIDATPNALMKIIMDPTAGDNIAGRGNGNLQIKFYNKGNFQIFGNYLIEEGIYKMSMQNIIRKDFVLQPGGLVSFNGDPRNANLNVQAVYTVNSASLNDLIPDGSYNKGTVKVNCLLNLTGNLQTPTLNFDLDLPTVNDEDRELVRSLTNTEEQMNTQIIYLLGIGKFYTYDYATNNKQTDATSSLAFSTLSGQLNNMLSQVINNQNWNLGTNLSTGEKGWTDVEAEAILSGRLLNNRLIINGNFGYRDNPMRNTNFVGDFEAMWLLTKNGEFRLKGYNQTNDRYFTKSTLTTQGVGLMYKKDFTNWRELIDWMLLRKRRYRKQSDNSNKETNNSNINKK